MIAGALGSLRAMTILPPSAGDEAVGAFRKMLAELELENRRLRAENNRLAHENGELCDRIFDPEQQLGLPAYPGCPAPERSARQTRTTMPEGLGPKEKTT